MDRATNISQRYLFIYLLVIRGLSNLWAAQGSRTGHENDSLELSTTIASLAVSIPITDLKISRASRVGQAVLYFRGLKRR